MVWVYDGLIWSWSGWSIVVLDGPRWLEMVWIDIVVQDDLCLEWYKTVCNGVGGSGSETVKMWFVTELVNVDPAETPVFF